MTQKEEVDPRDIALRWAKEIYPMVPREKQMEMEADFPELKQSEDERIKKDIITYLSTAEDKELIPYETWIAWIKKQGEQKSAHEELSPTWDEHDEMVRKVEEAFERSLEKFFSNRSELISKRKHHWRMSPPK